MAFPGDRQSRKESEKEKSRAFLSWQVCQGQPAEECETLCLARASNR